MNKIFLLLIVSLSVLFFSCNSSKKLSRTPKHLSQQLDIPVSKKDDLKLYTEASAWLGVPYRYGGNTKSGVDCSGLVCNIYKQVYHIKLERTVKDMYTQNCRKISRKRLRPGDLVFFNTAKSHKSPSHVGIYLKKDTFIHSTTSSGVRTSNLDEAYYKKRWINGGKVR